MEGTAYSFEYRIHDARLGRFLSVDPLVRCFPWNSPYSFAENDVVRCIDFEGKEKLEVNGNKIKIQLTYFVYTEGEGAFTNVSTARDIANQIATNSSGTYEVLEDVSLVATDGMSFLYMILVVIVQKETILEGRDKTQKLRIKIN